MTTARKGMFSRQDMEVKATPVVKSKAEKLDLVFTYGYIQVDTDFHKASKKIKDLAGECWKLHAEQENEIQKSGFSVYDKSICQILGNTLNLDGRQKQIEKDRAEWEIAAGLACEELSKRNRGVHITPLFFFKAEIKGGKVFNDFDSLREYIANPTPAEKPKPARPRR